MAGIVVGNRFFEPDPDKTGRAHDKLKAFVENMTSTGRFRKILIAVNIDADRSDAVNFLNGLARPDVVVIPVSPWGRFVPALSALLHHACLEDADHIFYASTELNLTGDAFDLLLEQVNESTLVAGACLEGHVFAEGEHQCEGHTCPWNTAALWRVKNGLDRLGFPAVGEALFGPLAAAGVEEVNAVNLYQTVYTDCAAVLVQIPDARWEADRSSAPPEQVETKMLTKNSRPEQQRRHAQLKAGRVTHIRSC